MTRDLVIEVEFLAGVAVLAQPQRPDAAEWPPHPDRLYQALVAAWSRRPDRDPAERVALEWLEALTPPLVAAPPAFRRRVLASFVPVNDRAWGRPFQARFHPAVIPDATWGPLAYCWRGPENLDRHLPALDRLRREVAYLGASHSLVLLRFGAQWPDRPFWRGPLRVPYRGRLAELERSWAGGYRAVPSRVLSHAG